jgi:hypothetical protein
VWEPFAVAGVASPLCALARAADSPHNQSMWRRRRNMLRNCLIAVPLCLCGCSDDAEKLDDAAKTATSWSATLEMTARQWSQDELPAAYVQQLGQAADKALAKKADTLKEIPPDNPRRQAIDARIGQLRQQAVQLTAAADRDDRAAAGQFIHLSFAHPQARCNPLLRYSGGGSGRGLGQTAPLAGAPTPTLPRSTGGGRLTPCAILGSSSVISATCKSKEDHGRSPADGGAR